MRAVGKTMGMAALASAWRGVRRQESQSIEGSVCGGVSWLLSMKTTVWPVSTSVAETVTPRRSPLPTFSCSARQGTSVRTSSASGAASRSEREPPT